jgi:hypothetical protein
MTMAKMEQDLPETMVSPESGETLIRGLRPFAVAYNGSSFTVNLPGYYPPGDGDGIHIGEDMAVVDDALRQLRFTMLEALDTKTRKAQSFTSRLDEQDGPVSLCSLRA